MIDENELVLYRKIKDGKEQTVPLHKNKAVHKFVCVATQELYELIEDAIERGSE